MGHEVTIGGQRLGNGNRMKAYLRNYERSTHDTSFVWRSTMAAGTLVPFMTEVGLPGDTLDIDLNVDILTHPTIGPLFGTYKIQLDVFQVPIRLYQGQLHMNMLGIGLDMSKILLPKIDVYGGAIDKTKPIDNQHTNPSSILAYLGIRGVGHHPTDDTLGVGRLFNAVPFLGYWDIYKNYYANKQEEFGVVIHKNPEDENVVITAANMKGANPDIAIPIDAGHVPPYTYVDTVLDGNSTMEIAATGMNTFTDPAQIWVQVKVPQGVGNFVEYRQPLSLYFQDFTINQTSSIIIASSPSPLYQGYNIGWGDIYYVNSPENASDQAPALVAFPLSNIDEMRKKILAHTDGTEFHVNKQAGDGPDGYLMPYGLPFMVATIGAGPALRRSQLFSQEGLALKTYNSDLFNNWIQTEWIDGVDGISAVTAIDTTSGSFTIDELNLSKKIYDMLNRIAISGGSYDDWLDAVYTHERQRSAENPMYLGGLQTKLIFQEVISNATTENQPLGTLAGRGRVVGDRKGGNIIAKIDEPSYVMGIISITPQIDYSQGNKWDTTLKSINDLHKPALDEIGFQDLITDQMAWWDTEVGNLVTDPINFRSAGKQPAWVNYMTNVNVVRGNFADQAQQMFMVLNRRYQPRYGSAQNSTTIQDLTTYIDPTKFNNIFADTRLDAQNFWAQVGVNITARRKMSAKVMPNL